MATVIDKLFKGYSIKEIEEILFKVGLNADKSKKEPYPVILKSPSPGEKRMLSV